MDGGGTCPPLGPEELRLFAESLAALVKARLPLPEALRVLGAQVGEPRPVAR